MASLWTVWLYLDWYLCAGKILLSLLQVEPSQLCWPLMSLSCIGEHSTGPLVPLTSVKKGRITSLGLLAMLCLTQPRRLVAFFARIHYWLMFVLSTMTSRLFSAKLLSSQSGKAASYIKDAGNLKMLLFLLITSVNQNICMSCRIIAPGSKKEVNSEFWWFTVDSDFYKNRFYSFLETFVDGLRYFAELSPGWIFNLEMLMPWSLKWESKYGDWLTVYKNLWYLWRTTWSHSLNHSSLVLCNIDLLTL